VPKGWEAYISGEFSEIHEELVKNGWTKLIIDEVRDDELITEIGNADVVLLWEAYEFLETFGAIGMNTVAKLNMCLWRGSA